MLFSVLSAQSWQSRYNGPGNDEDLGYGVVADPSGNAYVTGASWGLSTSYDAATVKYGPAGESLWAVRYDGATHGPDEARGIAISGNTVAITGATSDANLFTDVLTAAYDRSGALLWSATYNGPSGGNDMGFASAVDNSGNVYVTGFAHDDSTSWDVVTIKYNSAGVRQWASSYRTDYEDFGSHITLDDAGNVYVVGSSGNPYLLTWDFVTIKYNSGGVEQWAERYNGPAGEDDEPHGIAVDNSGNVFVCGGSLDSTSGLDYVTIKYNAAGETAWVRRYNGPANSSDEANALGLDDAGNVYVTGYSQGQGTDVDYATVKYDPAGNQLWAMRYDGPASGFDEARAIAVDGGGFATVTGSSAGTGTSADYATVRYRPDGTEESAQRYNGPGNDFDEANAIVLDPTGGVIVTGSSFGSGTGNDYATLRYAAVGIEEGSRPAADGSRPATVVRNVLILQSAFCNLTSEISLLDASGRCVLTRPLGHLAAGPLSLDVSTVPPGLYFIAGRSAVSGERSALLKLIIAK